MQSAIVPYIFLVAPLIGHLDTIIAFSGISYEKIVHKKDPGNRENGVLLPGLFDNSTKTRIRAFFSP